jgi:hypothetical protein
VTWVRTAGGVEVGGSGGASRRYSAPSDRIRVVGQVLWAAKGNLVSCAPSPHLLLNALRDGGPPATCVVERPRLGLKSRPRLGRWAKSVEINTNI